jgi:hypothetical protein
MAARRRVPRPAGRLKDMDPTAALESVTDALREDDIPRAAMAIEDLELWLRKGGFPPEGDALADFFQELLSSWARMHGEGP